MTATQSPARFVIFTIDGGCDCCGTGDRETVLPEGWRERVEEIGITSVEAILAIGHNVPAERVVQLYGCNAPFNRETIDAMRAKSGRTA